MSVIVESNSLFVQPVASRPSRFAKKNLWARKPEKKIKAYMAMLSKFDMIDLNRTYATSQNSAYYSAVGVVWKAHLRRTLLTYSACVSIEWLLMNRNLLPY